MFVQQCGSTAAHQLWTDSSTFHAVPLCCSLGWFVRDVSSGRTLISHPIAAPPAAAHTLLLGFCYYLLRPPPLLLLLVLLVLLVLILMLSRGAHAVGCNRAQRLL